MSKNGPVLIDFRIANPEDSSSLTTTGLVAGSPAWLSPEQASLHDVTPASDIFSLGSLLTFAATGRPPFGQGAQIATLLAISSNEPDLAGCSPAQHRLLVSMLSKNPGQRPNARQVLALAKAGSAQPPTVTPEPIPGTKVMAAPQLGGTLPQGLAAPIGDPTKRLGESADLPGTGDSSTTPPVSPAGPADGPPAPLPPPEQAGRRRPMWILAAVVTVALVLGGGWYLTQGLGEFGGGASPSASASPSGTAPSSDQLVSGDWSMSGYTIGNDGGVLSVSGKVTNNGKSAQSGNVSVEVYADGQYVGTATGTVSDVPAGGSQNVTLTSTAKWQPGLPTIVLQVS